MQLSRFKIIERIMMVYAFEQSVTHIRFSEVGHFQALSQRPMACNLRTLSCKLFQKRCSLSETAHLLDRFSFILSDSL